MYRLQFAVVLALSQACLNATPKPHLRHRQFFFFFAIIAIDPNAGSNYGYQYNGLESCVVDHNVAFTLPVLSLVVITILNDGTIITIAYDKVIPENTPQKWDMGEVRPCQLR